MGSLADLIEQYLQQLLAQANQVELQRRELAKMFRCVPSQINYVLETRFTVDRGYLIESRRGGGDLSGSTGSKECPGGSPCGFLNG